LPIVLICPDFKSAGLVVNLARPGQSITGVTLLGQDLAAKRMEVLRAAVPKASRVAFVWRSLYDRTFFGQEMEAAARRVGLTVLATRDVRGGAEAPNVFAAMARDRADAVVVSSDPLSTLYHTRIIDLAITHRLPTMFDVREFVDAGGLISYGPTTSEILGRVAGLVDRILKGAKPGELPVEQPTKLELAVNLKTARALGLTIAPSLLQRADHVIE
jgi:putative ABC transport system substrate-binding protein